MQRITKFVAHGIIDGDVQGDRASRVLGGEAQGKNHLVLVSKSLRAAFFVTRGLWEQDFRFGEIFRFREIETWRDAGLSGIAPVGQGVSGQADAKSRIARPGVAASAVNQLRVHRDRRRRGLARRGEKSHGGKYENKKKGWGFSLRVHPLAYPRETADPNVPDRNSAAFGTDVRDFCAKVCVLFTARRSMGSMT